jgi:YebC/PmpR family DNA-binding regulatory protein
MSRHSKWSTIKRQKGVADQKRGMVFTKLANAITIAARHGPPDPEMNFKLRMAIDKARAANMPKDNIERAIARAKGAEGAALEQIQYEAVGPGGVGIVVTATTDNRSRLLNTLKLTLKKFDSSLAGPNAVLWQFALRGHVIIEPPATKDAREALELTAIDAGADNIEEGRDVIAVTCDPHALEAVKATVERAGSAVKETGMGLIPNVTIPLPDTAVSERLDNLVAALEEIDEVDEVVTNAA